jgi:hypothetical protein
VGKNVNKIVEQIVIVLVQQDVPAVIGVVGYSVEMDVKLLVQMDANLDVKIIVVQLVEEPVCLHLMQNL